MASNRLTVTDLDFDTIKTNLKTYLQAQAEFTDYDFEASGLSVLLDIIVGSALRTMSTLGTTFVNPSRIEFEMTASADGAAGQIILSYIVTGKQIGRAHV